MVVSNQVRTPVSVGKRTASTTTLAATKPQNTGCAAGHQDDQGQKRGRFGQGAADDRRHEEQRHQPRQQARRFHVGRSLGRESPHARFDHRTRDNQRDRELDRHQDRHDPIQRRLAEAARLGGILTQQNYGGEDDHPDDHRRDEDLRYAMRCLRGGGHRDSIDAAFAA
ncbi:MAG: hypothetical protein QM811_12030 [Pirellulales bacterium]